MQLARFTTGLKTYGPPLLALVLIWALYFWRFVAPNPADRLTYEPGDFSETFGVFRDLGYRAALQGHLALWEACLWGGYPLHADPQAQTFYPVRWVTFGILRGLGFGHFPLDALAAETAVHYLFTSIFFCLFLRSRQIQWAAAVLGAVTFTYGGYLTGYPPLQNAVLATNLWLPLALWAASRLAQFRRPRDITFLVLVLACAFFAGHPQTFLFINLVTFAYFAFCLFNAKATPRTFVGLSGVVIILTALVTAGQLLPSLVFIANSTRAALPFTKASSGFPFQDLLSLFIANFVSYWNPLYVGVLPLGLALFALRPAQAERRFWAGLALVALIISFGTRAIGYDAAYWSIPGLGLFQGAERLALIFSTALAVLAAFGAHDVFVSLNQPQRTALYRLALGSGFLLIIGLLVTGFLTFSVYTGTAPESWAQLPERFGQFTLMSGLALAAWLLRARVPSLHRWLPLVFITFTVIDLFAANRPLNVRAPYEAYGPSVIIQPIVEDTSFFRVQDDARLPGHAGCVYGYREIDGVTPYKLAAYEKLLPLEEMLRWQLLGVKYVVSWRGEIAGAEKIAENDILDEKGNPTRTHRLQTQPQRAWLAPLPDLTISGPVYSLPETGLGTVNEITEQPGKITLNVQVQKEALLVVSEAYFTGWRVTVDGNEVPITPNNQEALLGVQLPAGQHLVNFTYAPASLTWGGILSLIGLALTAILAALPQWPRRP